MQAEHRQPHLPLELYGIYVKSADLQLLNGFDPLVPNQEVIGRFKQPLVRAEKKMKPIGNDGSDCIACDYTMRFEFLYFKPDENGREPSEAEAEKYMVAKLSVDFVSSYVVVGDSNIEVTDDFIYGFGNTQLALHVWPYWREFCQSSMYRMALPPLLMPLLPVAVPMDQDQRLPPKEGDA